MVDQIHRKLEKYIADGLIHVHDVKPNPGAGIKETVEELLKRAFGDLATVKANIVNMNNATISLELNLKFAKPCELASDCSPGT